MMNKQDRAEGLLRALAVLWVFVLVLGLSPYTMDPATPIKWLMTSGITAMMAVVALFARPARGAAGTLPFVLLLFAVVYIGAAFVSPWRWQSLMSLGPWLNFMVFALLLPRAVRTVEHAERLLVAAVIAVALSSVYGMAQKLGYDPFPWAITDRYEYSGLPATYGHPNFAGHVLIPAIVLALGLLFSVRQIALRAVLLAVCALMLAHLHYTGMRAGWLALGGAAAVFVLALALRRFTKRGDRFPVVLLGTLLACAAVGVGGLAYALHAWPNARLDIDSSWILRLNGYLGSTELFFDHPWTGTGPGTFRDAIVPYWTDFEQRWFILYNMRNNHAHNELLEAAVEAGLPGLAATLLLFIAVLFSTLQLATSACTRGLGLMLFVAVVAMLIDAQFGFNLHTPAAAGLFFLMAGLVITLQRIDLGGISLVPSPPPMAGTLDQGETLGRGQACPPQAG